MIQIRNLTVGYGEKKVLRSITLDVEAGGFYAVMGANGCGKTTLLRCVANHLRPSEGEVLVDGKRVGDYTAKELAKRIALVRQQAQTDFEFTAFETVMMGRNPYQRRLQNESDMDKAIVEECMRKTNTWHLRESRPNEMSGGELQRVMLARALAQQTPVLLLDEPLSNLDIAHQFEMMELLRCCEDKTILLVVHDLNLAYRYCNKLLLLHEGNVLFWGDMKEGLTPERIRNVYGIDGKVDAERGCLMLSPKG